jgi:hypothetical protein
VSSVSSHKTFLAGPNLFEEVGFYIETKISRQNMGDGYISDHECSSYTSDGVCSLCGHSSRGKDKKWSYHMALATPGISEANQVTIAMQLSLVESKAHERALVERTPRALDDDDVLEVSRVSRKRPRTVKPKSSQAEVKSQSASETVQENNQSTAKKQKVVEDCVVCMSTPAEYAILPCGHFCLCEACLTRGGYMSGGRTKKCPKCRGRITKTCKIYL